MWASRLAAVTGGGVVAALLAGCALVTSAGAKDSKLLLPAQRQALLRRAQIWMPTDVAAADIRRGPDGGFPPDADVECTFKDTRLGGHTPKFACQLASGEVVKVRFGADNGEVYAGVAATRLLWALGYGADALYPVHVLCRDCPASSQGRDVAERVTRFEIAAIERPFPGRQINARHTDEGWGWPDLQDVDPAAGGATREQRDGLKLLAVLIQHTDNKPEQQRFVCRDNVKSRDALAACDQPFLLIHDVGQTFGRANWLNRASVGSVNLDLWSHTPIWKDRARCVGNLYGSHTGSMADPMISEGGRAFLARLLEQLSEQQLRDLFTVARFDRKPHGGGPIDAWVKAFEQKRAEISGLTCPS